MRVLAARRIQLRAYLAVLATVGGVPFAAIWDEVDGLCRQMGIEAGLRLRAAVNPTTLRSRLSE